MYVGTPWSSIAEFTRRSLVSGYHAATHYTREFNFIHACARRSDFCASILVKRTKGQQQHLQTFYTEFHPNRTTNVGSAYIYLRPP